MLPKSQIILEYTLVFHHNNDPLFAIKLRKNLVLNFQLDQEIILKTQTNLISRLLIIMIQIRNAI